MAQNLTEKKTEYNLLDLLFLILMTITSYYTRNIACQIMMVVFCGVVVINAMMKGLTPKHTWYFVGTALFIAYGYWGANYGPELINKSVSMTMVTSLVLNLIMVYAISQYILWTDNPDKVLKLFELSVFITAIIVLFASGGTIATGRLGKGTEINANSLALLAVYGITLCMYFMKQQGASKLGWLKILFYVAIVLLSGSRKGLILIVLSVLLVNLIQGGTRKIFSNIFTVGIVIIILYIIVMKVPVLYNIIGVRVEDLIDLLTEDSTQDYSLMNRQALIEMGWKYIGKHPWVGYGLDNFKVVSDIAGTGNYNLYSHNNYVELLFGGGIIGTVLYYLPIIGILIGLIKNLKAHPCVAYVLTILIAKHAIEYACVTYYERMDAYIIAIILGCLLWCRNNKIKDESKALQGEKV